LTTFSDLFDEAGGALSLGFSDGKTGLVLGVPLMESGGLQVLPLMMWAGRRSTTLSSGTQFQPLK